MRDWIALVLLAGCSLAIDVDGQPGGPPADGADALGPPPTDAAAPDALAAPSDAAGPDVAADATPGDATLPRVPTCVDCLDDEPFWVRCRRAGFGDAGEPICADRGGAPCRAPAECCAAAHRTDDCETCLDGFGGDPCEPLVDTAPLPPQNRWGPAARVTWADVPADANDAVARGCDVAGTHGGSGLQGLIALGSSSLPERLEPDETGAIELILLGHLAGWTTGQTGNEAGVADLRFYLGSQSAGGRFSIQARSFVGGDPNAEPLDHFPGARIAGAQISSDAVPFTLTLDLVGDLPLSLRLTATHIAGALSVDGAGFAVRGGRLSGYLTRAALLETIGEIRTACGAPDPPALCADVEPFIPAQGTPERALALVVALLGGFDARIEQPTPIACDPAAGIECDAVSVCLVLEMHGVIIDGVEN